ncbi:MBL fold metallo-hydrolase [Candidatus Parcubacteria bacterium]|nr:MBL fold metallo-hydrolase [Candidatus Parcubacteria bacterium]
MKITKYPQSCLLLEKDGRRIAIDPGSFFTDRYRAQDLGAIEAVLYTHQHADHFDQSLVNEFKAAGVALYGNRAVCQLIGEGARPADSGQPFEVAGFNVTPHDLPHCRLVDGSDGPPNTGYIIDGHFFHPGDGVETEGVQVDHLALPIAGPSVSFYHAAKFAKSLGAQKVIPIHYHSFKADPHDFASRFQDAEVIVLESGESVELAQ